MYFGVAFCTLEKIFFIPSENLICLLVKKKKRIERRGPDPSVLSSSLVVIGIESGLKPQREMVVMGPLLH